MFLYSFINQLQICFLFKIIKTFITFELIFENIVIRSIFISQFAVKAPIIANWNIPVILIVTEEYTVFFVVFWPKKSLEYCHNLLWATLYYKIDDVGKSQTNVRQKPTQNDLTHGLTLFLMVKN